VVTVAVVLRRFGLHDFTFSDLARTLTFLAVVTGATAVGSLAWSPGMELWRGGNLWSGWYLMVLSNLLPFIMITPGLLALAIRGADIIRATGPRQGEFAALVFGLLVCGLGIFGIDALPAGALWAVLYLPLPFLLWGAVRFGAAGLSLAFLMFSSMVILYSAAGQGPFVTQSQAANVLWIQAFLLAFYVPLLVLASVVRERTDKERALKESEARYRAVVEDQTELICRFLPDGTYTFVNDAYCRYFDSSPEQLLGRSFWTFLPPGEHEGARRFLESITPEHPIATREHEVVTAKGELRWHQWTDRALIGPHGRIVEYQAVGRDITERKHLEEAMRGLAHVERLAVVGELTGSIAHEVTQPLTAILANAEAAERQLRSPAPPLDEIRAILADIRHDDLRASEVLQRMRALLRKREPVISTFRTDGLVADVLALIRAEARRRRVTVETSADPTPDVDGDRVLLQQVLLNLIMNGMEAMSAVSEDRRRLDVCSEREGSAHVRISVSDRGEGIPPDSLARVFESFYTTKEHGMGLGLPIARSIVELHDGRIWAENRPDGGARFCFTLPIAAAGRHSTARATSR
jgi:PAS domain S-box-containing protein